MTYRTYSSTRCSASAAEKEEAWKHYLAEVWPKYKARAPQMHQLMPSLNKILTAPVFNFREQATKVWETPDGPLMYTNNGGNVLMVGHLDVYNDRLWPRVHYKPDLQMINCLQLDDRLGVWALMYLLPKLTDTKFDLMLTVGEETGKSTAKRFNQNMLQEIFPDGTPRWKWMGELDRMGSGYVCYEYGEGKEADDLHAALKKSSAWCDGHGSYTDIRSLDWLGVRGINFGIGYHRQHTDDCHAFLNEVMQCVVRVAHFLDNNNETTFPFQLPPPPKTTVTVTAGDKTHKKDEKGAWSTSTGQTGESRKQQGSQTGSGQSGGPRPEKKDYIPEGCATRSQWCPVRKGSRLAYWDFSLRTYVFRYDKEEIKALRKECMQHPYAVLSIPYMRNFIYWYLDGNVPQQFSSLLRAQGWFQPTLRESDYFASVSPKVAQAIEEIATGKSLDRDTVPAIICPNEACKSALAPSTTRVFCEACGTRIEPIVVVQNGGGAASEGGLILLGESSKGTKDGSPNDTIPF